MLELIRQTLAHNQLALLFLTIGIGYLLSQVRYRGVGLGVASVLFVGLGLGAWGGEEFELPEFVSQVGLLLFVYTIALQAGPAFFRILQRRGLGIGLLALGAVGAAGLFTILAAQVFHLDPALAVGLFCGGLTNTPALAAVSEALRGSPNAMLPTVGYSIAYPLAVALPIVLAEFTARWRHLDIAHETEIAEREAEGYTEPPIGRNLRVTSLEVVGRPLGELKLSSLPITLSRVQKGEHQVVATPSTVLDIGDILHVVGSPEALAQAEALVGPAMLNVPGPETRRDEVDFRRIMVSNPELVGKKLRDIDFSHQWEAVITRIRRGDLDFMPSPDTILERGDRVRVVARTDQMPNVVRYLGDSFRAVSETDFLSLSLGLVLGLFLGSIRVQLPGGLVLQLGLAGGPLVAALVLGYLNRTGPIVWSLPLAANLAFRQLGLVLFFAAVGLRAGRHFGTALAAHGPMLIFVGACVTLASSCVLLFGAMRLLKVDWVTATGILAGGQTQPALLTFVGDRSQSEAPNAAYVAIMPTAMIAKILLAQILLWLLTRF